MTKRFSPRVPSDPRADEGTTLDMFDIEATTSNQATESSATRERVTALGRCACVAYLHAELATGAPSTLASAGTRITTVGTTIAIALEPEIQTPYSARVDDQADASDLVYRVDDQLSGSITVRATDLAGVAVDLSIGDRAFCLEIHQLLPEVF